MHSKTKSKPNTKRTSNRVSQSRVEFQHVEDNMDEQTDKHTTQQQSFQSSSSSYPKTASTINITTDTDESVDDEQEGNDFNTLKSEMWHYATKLHNGKAKCNKCDHEISCQDHSTIGLCRHLYHCIKIPSFT